MSGGAGAALPCTASGGARPARGAIPLALEPLEGVLLQHAVIDQLARESGIRVLFLKGPVLELQGLRPRRVSVDVDVLAEPTRSNRLCDAFRQKGWQDEGQHSRAFILPLHSTTFRHPFWPCEIDVHHWFPGFFGDPAVVFEKLWARRTTARIAGRDVPCPDLIGNAAIAALHRLRDPDSETSRQELSHMADVLRERLDDDGLRELAELAAATGAADTLRPFLDAVGAPEIGTGTTSPEDLRAWQIRAASSGMKSVPWLVELSQTRVHRWPAALWRALTLTEHEIRLIQPGAKPGWRGLLVARLRRIGWGVRSLPKAAALVWGFRHWGAAT